MNVGILGTGSLAVALGRVWAARGHGVVVTGRDASRAERAAAGMDGSAADASGAGSAAGAASAAAPKAVLPSDFAAAADVIVVAIAWDGLASALESVGASRGSLRGKTVVDCTNAIDFATGRLKLPEGSAAEVVASLAGDGAHVVKALHLFAGASWPYQGPEAPVVAVCGDDSGALATVSALIGDLGARTAVIGGLDAARQLEEVAGFVMRVVAAGFNPRLAVPDVRLG